LRAFVGWRVSAPLRAFVGWRASATLRAFATLLDFFSLRLIFAVDDVNGSTLKYILQSIRYEFP
jgi:hypothetical protein